MDNCNMTFTTKFLIATLLTTGLASCNTSNVSNEQADTSKSATTTKSTPTKSIPASTGVVHISSDQSSMRLLFKIEYAPRTVVRLVNICNCFSVYYWTAKI